MSKKRCYVQRMLMCSLLAGGCFCLPGYAGGGDKPEAGMKTDAGKQRIVPVHSKIRHLVKRNYDFETGC